MVALKDPDFSPSASDIDAGPDQTIDPAIEITGTALRQIKRALARFRQTDERAFLRVGVKGGGCSGMSYVMEPDSEFDARDRTWLIDGVRVVTDDRSLRYIAGMTIDYDIKNLMEGGFVFRNPNAARSCGCGTSFTPK